MRCKHLREVTALFLADTDAYSGAERAHFGAIMGRIAEDMEVVVRQDLAHALATLSSAPHALIQQLADNEFNVAQEVLTQSPVLGDADLVDIAKTKGMEHLEAIAVRPSVSPAVSDTLLTRGNDTVLVKLVSNAGAELSRDAIEKVARHAFLKGAARRKPIVTAAAS